MAETPVSTLWFRFYFAALCNLLHVGKSNSDKLPHSGVPAGALQSWRKRRSQKMAQKSAACSLASIQ